MRSRWLVTLATLLVLRVPQVAGAVPTPNESPAFTIDTCGKVSAETIAEYRKVTDAALAFYRKTFGALPLPPFKITLCENAEAVVRYFVDVAKWPEDVARTYAVNFMGWAFGWSDTIVIDVEREWWPSFAIGHELMHLLQYHWSNGRWIWSWFDEGMAELWGAKFEESYGFIPAEYTRDLAVAAVRAKWTDLRKESLFKLDWLAANKTYGSVGGYRIAYAYARLAYEYLESRNTPEATIRFYRALAKGTPANDAFKSVFGMTTAEFDAAFRLYVDALFTK